MTLYANLPASLPSVKDLMCGTAPPTLKAPKITENIIAMTIPPE